MIENFHISELNLEDEKIVSGLSAIAYNLKKPHADYAKEISVAMCDYPWFEVYGLDYNQVMQLPFDEYKILLKNLIARPKDQAIPMMTRSVTELIRVLFALYAKPSPQKS